MMTDAERAAAERAALLMKKPTLTQRGHEKMMQVRAGLMEVERGLNGLGREQGWVYPMMFARLIGFVRLWLENEWGLSGKE